METVPIPEEVAAQSLSTESNPADTAIVASPEVSVGEAVVSEPEGGSLHYLPGHEPSIAVETPAGITDVDQIQGVAISMQPQMSEAVRIESDAADLRSNVALEQAETLSVNQLPGVEEKAADALEARAGELRVQAEAKAVNVVGPEPGPVMPQSVSPEGSTQAA